MQFSFSFCYAYCFGVCGVSGWNGSTHVWFFFCVCVIFHIVVWRRTDALGRLRYCLDIYSWFSKARLRYNSTEPMEAKRLYVNSRDKKEKTFVNLFRSFFEASICWLSCKGNTCNLSSKYWLNINYLLSLATSFIAIYLNFKSMGCPLIAFVCIFSVFKTLGLFVITQIM